MVARMSLEEFDTVANSLRLPPAAAGGEPAPLTPAQRSQVGLIWETARYACGAVSLSVVQVRQATEKEERDRKHALDLAKASSVAAP